MTDNKRFTTNTSILQLATLGNGRILNLSNSPYGKFTLTNSKGDSISVSRGQFDELVRDGYLIPKKRGTIYALTWKALNMATRRR